MGIDPLNLEIVAACMEIDMGHVGEAFRNLHSAVFCVESSRVSELFAGDAVRAHALESDPNLSCAIVERDLLRLGHSGAGMLRTAPDEN